PPVKSQDPLLLLDYSGAKGTTLQNGTKKITENVPVETLVMTPEGKLLVRTQEEDAQSTEPGSRNQVRKERLDSWQDWMKQVKLGLAGKNKMDLFNKQAVPGREVGGRRSR